MDTTCVMKEEHQVITHTHTDGHNMRDEGRTPSDHTHTQTDGHNMRDEGRTPSDHTHTHRWTQHA